MIKYYVQVLQLLSEEQCIEQISNTPSAAARRQGTSDKSPGTKKRPFICVSSPDPNLVQVRFFRSFSSLRLSVCVFSVFGTNDAPGVLLVRIYLSYNVAIHEVSTAATTSYCIINTTSCRHKQILASNRP